MRLSAQQIARIREVVHQEAGPDARVRLFGSRLNDERRGGDVDLLVELDRPVANPAWLAARISGRMTRYMLGREVDVLLSAPNLLRGAIHAVAEQEGHLL